jgi:hypothetical protein
MTKKIKANSIQAKPTKGQQIIKGEEPTTNTKLLWALWALFVLLSAVGAFKHELWQDELQAWIIAGESKNFLDLLFNLRFEGHPALWHFLLFVAQFISKMPETMQVVHFLIIISVGWIMVFNSPFTFLQKAAILGGYFFLFEYNIVTRNYAIGLLCLMLILVWFKDYKENRLKLGILFFLMTNSNLYAALLAGVLLLALIIYSLQNADNKISLSNPMVLILLIAIIGFIFSAWQIMPNEHNRNYLRYPDGLDFERIKFSFVNFTKVLIPLPNINQITWWNTNSLISNPMQISNGEFIFSFILFLVPIGWFYKNRISLLVYVCSSLLITTFTYITWVPYIRYIGHIYLAIISAWWLNISLDSKKLNADIFFNFKKYGLTLMLIVQLIAGFMAYWGDFKSKFSRVKDTASFILTNKLDADVMFGYTDYTTTGLCAYLNKPLFFVQRDTLGKFVYWDDKRNHFMDIKTALDSAASKINNKPGNYLFISSLQIFVNNNGKQVALLDSVYLNNKTRLVFINKFDKAITGNDNFYLYRLSN